MGLFLVGCLLLGLSRVLTPQFPPHNLVFSQTSGLHLLRKISTRTTRVKMVMVLVEKKVCKISMCRRRALGMGSLLR
jgi:hypothetical protein